MESRNESVASASSSRIFLEICSLVPFALHSHPIYMQNVVVCEYNTVRVYVILCQRFFAGPKAFIIASYFAGPQQSQPPLNTAYAIFDGANFFRLRSASARMQIISKWMQWKRR